MGLFKAIIYVCIALFITNIVTQNDRKLIRNIPVLGETIANIENLNLYIIIICLVVMIFFI
jgi:hypothetical protein